VTTFLFIGGRLFIAPPVISINVPVEKEVSSDNSHKIAFTTSSGCLSSFHWDGVFDPVYSIGLATTCMNISVDKTRSDSIYSDSLVCYFF